MKEKETSSIERPPIIVIMGHIDHGKSTLLDYIRKSNSVAGEAGGITQHTSAYEVEHETPEGVIKKITFLDTPGHAAFTEMRSRGAVVADIAILVVSAEDGVKTQTLDALRAIQDANIPYIVAINKIDRPGADIDRTKNSLLENGIYVEGYGGNIPVVPISAKTGEGIPALLDMMLLVAEIEELTGDPNTNATGVVIEANVDPKKGISATLVIKNGVLKKGMCVASEDSVAPVRIFENFQGDTIDEATFSSPIKIVGWSKLPRVGALFESFEKKKDAEACALEHKSTPQAAPTLLHSEETENQFFIPLVLKADVAGTLDAVKYEIQKIKLERTLLHVISSGVGTINENDIKMASGSNNAIVLGFNVSIDNQARTIAEQSGLTIKTFDIIYKMTEWLEEEAKIKTPKIDTEEIEGTVRVLKIFSQQKKICVFGGKVLEGFIKTGMNIRITRKEVVIGTGKILELQSQRIKVDIIKDETEFGARVESSVDIAQNDIIEAITIIHA